MSVDTDHLTALLSRLEDVQMRPRLGRLTRVDARILTASMGGVSVGDLCLIARANDRPLRAEAIAVHQDSVILAPYGTTDGLTAGQLVRPTSDKLSIPIGFEKLGRVIDPFGLSLEAYEEEASGTAYAPIKHASMSPMHRPVIDALFATGINAIDGPLALGQGQRVGLFGPPGTGKSRLMADIASSAKVDIVVIGLVGERGREVREFVDKDLPAERRRRTVVIAATSDRPSAERALCAQSATAVAEWFRDQGKNVLLIIDSLTRTARALREIGLAAGEAPTRRGYPSSVYPALPALIERTGRTEKGNITAIYTVLSEGDGDGDPIAEEVRSLTDGHIVLSRDLAEAGHFPAIDVLASLSRCMPLVATQEHQKNAQSMRQLISKYKEIELLLQIGEYKKGMDKIADMSIRVKSKIDEFLTEPGNPAHAKNASDRMGRIVK